MTSSAPVYGVPTGWTVSTVDQIKSKEPYSCVAGPFGSSISSKFFVAEGIPVIRGSNLRDDLTRFVPEGLVFVSEQQAARYRPQHVRAGDLVFTCWGTIGQVGIIPEGSQYDAYIISNKQLKLSVNSEILDPFFCFYYFASPKYRDYIRMRNIGGAVPGINLGILKSLPIAFPELKVQKTIAGIIGSYDDLIENNKRRIELLEQSARLLYREWFVRLKYPGHEHYKIVDGLPEGWRRTTLSRVSAYISRGISPIYDESADCLVINQKCIRNRLLDLKLAQQQSKPVPANKFLRIGDILINSTGTGTLGRVAQVTNDIEKCTVDSHITIVRPSDQVAWRYVGFSVIDRELYIATLGRGATNQTELSKSAVENLPIVIPKNELMSEFEAMAEPLVRQIGVLSRQNEQLARARDLLLPRLMDGRISV